MEYKLRALARSRGMAKLSFARIKLSLSTVARVVGEHASIHKFNSEASASSSASLLETREFWLNPILPCLLKNYYRRVK